jgi:hypothetical protein
LQQQKNFRRGVCCGVHAEARVVVALVEQRPEKTALTRPSSICKFIHPSSYQRGHHIKQTHNCLKIISRKKKRKIGHGHQMVASHLDRLAD